MKRTLCAVRSRPVIPAAFETDLPVIASRPALAFGKPEDRVREAIQGELGRTLQPSPLDCSVASLLAMTGRSVSKAAGVNRAVVKACEKGRRKRNRYGLRRGYSNAA